MEELVKVLLEKKPQEPADIVSLILKQNYIVFIFQIDMIKEWCIENESSFQIIIKVNVNRKNWKRKWKLR